MEEILQHFNNINEQLEEKMLKEKAEEIFKYIPMKMEQFYDKFDKECMHIPIFKYYDVFQMFQRISCASNEDIVTIKEKLLDRAKRNGENLQVELSNLEKLKQVIDDYISGKQPTIKLVILQDFADELENIIYEYRKAGKNEIINEQETVNEIINDNVNEIVNEPINVNNSNFGYTEQE